METALVRFVPFILFALFVTACENASDNNTLKERITQLESSVDSLRNEIKLLTESQRISTAKNKTTVKNTKPKKKDDDVITNQVLTEPVKEATMEKEKVEPIRTNSFSSSYSETSHQCVGTTKKGARCKRMVRGGNYCWQHGG